MFCILVGNVPKVAALWRKRKVLSGEKNIWDRKADLSQIPCHFSWYLFCLLSNYIVSKVILTLTLVAFSVLDNQLTIWHLRREMLVQFSVCSLLRESELETWKISSRPWEKSVTIEITFSYIQQVSTCVQHPNLILFAGERCENNLWPKLQKIQGYCLYWVCRDFFCTTCNWIDWPEAFRSPHHCSGLSGNGNFICIMWLHTLMHRRHVHNTLVLLAPCLNI